MIPPPESESFLSAQRKALASGVQTKAFEVSVAGVTFENRQTVVASLAVGQALRLTREPANPYDANAIRVDTVDGRSVGYLARDLARLLAPLFDRVEPQPATVIALVGGDLPGSSRGLRIRFSVGLTDDLHSLPLSTLENDL